MEMKYGDKINHVCINSSLHVCACTRAEAVFTLVSHVLNVLPHSSQTPHRLDYIYCQTLSIPQIPRSSLFTACIHNLFI